MIVNKVDKRIKASLNDVIKYQIMTYCFFNDIKVSRSDLECLTELAKKPESGLTEFCDYVASLKIFKTSQSVRNCISKCTKQNLITKSDTGKKKISLHEDLKVQSEGVIFLDFKVVSNES